MANTKITPFERFVEPRNFGCAGLIIVILLIVFLEKCSTCEVQPDNKSEKQPIQISDYNSTNYRLEK